MWPYKGNMKLNVCVASIDFNTQNAIQKGHNLIKINFSSI